MPDKKFADYTKSKADELDAKAGEAAAKVAEAALKAAQTGNVSALPGLIDKMARAFEKAGKKHLDAAKAYGDANLFGEQAAEEAVAGKDFATAGAIRGSLDEKDKAKELIQAAIDAYRDAGVHASGDGDRIKGSYYKRVARKLGEDYTAKGYKGLIYP